MNYCRVYYHVQNQAFARLSRKGCNTSLPAHPVLNRAEIQGEVCLVLGGKPGTGNGPGLCRGGTSTEREVVPTPRRLE